MIPLLPLLDEPIECVVDYMFDHAQPHRRVMTVDEEEAEQEYMEHLTEEV